MDITLRSVIFMVVLAGFLGSVLRFAYSRLKVEEDHRKQRLMELLPNVNCGACGAGSCADFADKLLKGETDISKCRLSLRDSRTADEIGSLLKKA